MATQISTNRYLTQAEYDDPATRAQVQAEIEACLRDTRLREDEFFASDVEYLLVRVPREQAAFAGELRLTGVIDVAEPADVIEPGSCPGELARSEQ